MHLRKLGDCATRTAYALLRDKANWKPMNGQFDLITLISLVVAAAAIWKLRNVLGQRTDEDDARVERLKVRDREAASQRAEGASADIVSLPRRGTDQTDVHPVNQEPDAPTAEALAKAYSTADVAVTTGLLDIAKRDPGFDPAAFVAGSSNAYEMIVVAFAEGDRKTLKDLLNREVFDGFVAVINEREKRGDSVEQQFVGIKKADIVEADENGGTASVTVKFVSELITATRDAAGQLLAGDPQKIVDVTDVWTFSRDVSSPRALENVNWRLVATQDPN